MPPSATGKAPGTASVTYRRPHHRLAERLLHLAQPWAMWAGVTVLGLVLRFAFSHLRLLTVILVLAAGAVMLALGVHLSRHHGTLPGRMIGPVTVALAAASLAVFLVSGFSTVLALVYLLGGVAVCGCWDAWILTADHRDLAAEFNAGAEAAGAPGARMMLRRSPGGKTGRGVVRAVLRLPSDPAMTDEEVAGRIGHIENVTRQPRGSFTMTGSPDDGGLAEVTIAPPSLLTAAPLPWPGPSAPGADMSVPFRIARLADGRDFAYPRLPVHHRKITGRTGGGKTILVWSMIAEGITRQEYAAVAADIGKGEQYLGPLRPALHRLATTPDKAIALLEGLNRARLARCNFLAKNHVIEWAPGCGLSFLDVFLEEAADILRLLGTTARHGDTGRYMVADWVQDVAESRSAGISWTASFQRPTKEQAVSAVVTSQMGSFCFGVAKDDDMVFGLSPEQRQRGARPTLFSTPAHRGMYYADTETVPEDCKAMAQRAWYWGPDASQIAEYAALPVHAAARRPLDDVTGEALEAGPGPLAGTAFPPPARYAAPPPPVRFADGNEDDDGDPDGEGNLAPVRQLRPALAPVPAAPARAAARPDMYQAEDMARAQVAAWRAEGRKFFVKRDCVPLMEATGRTTSWLYNTILPKLISEGLLARHEGGKMLRWDILPARRQENGDG